MNQQLIGISQTEQPLVSHMNDEHLHLFRKGLALIADFACTNFLDLPRITGRPDPQKDDLSYFINYLDQPVVSVNEDQCNLLTIYDPSNPVTHFPMRIDYRFETTNGTPTAAIRLINDMCPEMDPLLLMRYVCDETTESEIDIDDLNNITLSQMYHVMKITTPKPYHSNIY